MICHVLLFVIVVARASFPFVVQIHAQMKSPSAAIARTATKLFESIAGARKNMVYILMSFSIWDVGAPIAVATERYVFLRAIIKHGTKLKTNAL